MVATSQHKLTDISRIILRRALSWRALRASSTGLGVSSRSSASSGTPNSSAIFWLTTRSGKPSARSHLEIVLSE